MPIDNYGVWVAKPVRVSAERAEQDPNTPHIHFFYDDGSGGNFDKRPQGVNQCEIGVRAVGACILVCARFPASGR